MSVELRPFGVACNIGCRYCYQNPQREAGNVRQSYDLERMLAAVEKEGGPMTLFGGEPLLLPLPDLETILKWGFEKYGRNAVQTNAILIGDEHLRLFGLYNVDVGVSIDGPGELNDLRWDLTLERTRRDTETVERNIARLCREHRPPGLIVTLHRRNATAEHLPRMLAWMRELDALGIKSVRLHPLEVDSPSVRADCLTDAENAHAFLAFAALQTELTQLRFDVVDEIERSLLGRDGNTSCVWQACDPYTTEAVRGVEGNGQSSNCGRTNKDGVDFIKAERPGFERYLALMQTPQEHGGCKGCRFFLMCRGQCPGTAVDGDWRNRSELCGVWKRLFIHAEKTLILKNHVPLSIHPIRHRLERQLALLWARGRSSTIQRLSVSFRAAETARNPPQSARDAHVGRGSFAVVAAQEDTKVPPFVRRAFAGEAQRAAWEPRLAAIAAARLQLAIAAVAARAVPAAIVGVPAREVMAAHNAAAAKGLHTRLLSARGEKQQRVVIGSEEPVRRVEEAFRGGDADAVNAALGVPECCRAADGDVWSAAGAPPSDSVDVIAAPATNFLLRPLGVDLLGYTPCSFHCAASRARGDALLASARAAGIEAGAWIEAILSWPVEWSALHGIAEIKTAVVKISTNTAYTATKRTVRLHGTALPSDAARGLTFAFRAPSRRREASA